MEVITLFCGLILILTYSLANLSPTNPEANTTSASRDQHGDGSILYELSRQPDNHASNSFSQRVNRVRALEAELARAIGAIKNVKAARVHLILPNPELPSQRPQEPRASIVLEMKGANRLSKEQVTVIQNLVTTNNLDIKASNISIRDARGELTVEGVFGPTNEKTGKKNPRRAYETRLARTLEEVLEKQVGTGRVRAEVRADIDFHSSTQTGQETEDETASPNRLTAAILVDGIYKTDEAGNQNYHPRPKEEMERLALRAQSVMGFKAERGDSLDVINIRFDEPPMPKKGSWLHQAYAGFKRFFFD